MKRRNLLRNILCLLAAIAALLIAGTAMAEGEAPQLAVPSITLLANTAQRGEFLPVQVGEAEGAALYHVRIVNADDEPVGGAYG